MSNEQYLEEIKQTINERLEAGERVYESEILSYLGFKPTSYGFGEPYFDKQGLHCYGIPMNYVTDIFEGRTIPEKDTPMEEMYRRYSEQGWITLNEVATYFDGGEESPYGDKIGWKMQN